MLILTNSHYILLLLLRYILALCMRLNYFHPTPVREITYRCSWNLHGNPIDQSDDIQAWLMHGPWDEKSDEKKQTDTSSEIRSYFHLIFLLKPLSCWDNFNQTLSIGVAEIPRKSWMAVAFRLAFPKGLHPTLSNEKIPYRSWKARFGTVVSPRPEEDVADVVVIAVQDGLI